MTQCYCVKGCPDANKQEANIKVKLLSSTSSKNNKRANEGLYEYQQYTNIES